MKEKTGCLFDAVDRAAETAITVLFALMVIVGGMQVVSRYLLRHSLSWSEELQKYLHIWMIFIAIPLAYRRGAHIGMNILYDRLPPRARHAVGVLFDAMWLVLGVSMAIFTRPLMAVARGQTSPGLGLRMDFVYSCMVIGGAYIALTAIRNIITRLSAHDGGQQSGEED